MDTLPPINERSTDELLKVIENKEQWRDEIVRLAHIELINRGITLNTQKTRRKNRIRFLEKIQRIKSKASLDTTDKIMTAIFAPISFFHFLRSFLFHNNNGYENIYRQTLFYSIIGILLWGLILYLIMR